MHTTEQPMQQSKPATRNEQPKHKSAPAEGEAKPHARVVGAESKILLTDVEAAALLGVSVRKFHYIRPQLCEPRILGPRCVRYLRTEIEAGAANLPSASAHGEPAQLLRGKIERMMRTGCAS